MSTKRAPVDEIETLRHVLNNAEVLLLDFDGPVCSVFAGFPASVVADQLREILISESRKDIPPEVLETDDPFDVLKFAASLGNEEAEHVEAALRAHELEAIRTAEPTPGSHDLIRAWHATGSKLAIVSNNSAQAVQAYLDIHSLDSCIESNCSRTSFDPTLLKPAPFLLNKAMATLNTSPFKCVMVGDSISDIEATRAAGAISIGYANRLDKVEKFANISYTTIQSMEFLIEAVKEMESKSGR